MPVPVHEASLSPRAWAWLTLAATALLCGSVATLNALVDPTAQLGTGLLEPVAAGPRDRAAKAELLAGEAMPDVVVLGSSRTKKLDPAWLGAKHGVNAAVVGGDLFEARVLTAWLAERASRRGERMPRLVVGIDVEQFRDSSLQGSGFLDVPQLAAVARREAAGSDGGELERLERLLLTMQVTKASVASLRARVNRAAASEATASATAREGDFTAAGVPVGDRRWLDPSIARRLAERTPGAVQRAIAELRTTYEANGSRLDEDAVGDLRALVRLARHGGGAPPLLYVTPAHPHLAQSLADAGRPARERAVRALLDGIAAGGDARVVDCSTCIDAAATSWIDATHPSPLGMRQLARRLRGAA